jgi:CHAD domain-containing protein
VNCLEKYRAAVVGKTNRHLKTLLNAPDEQAAHEFRVGIKRLNALYRFLGEVGEGIQARKLMKPARGLFKRVGPIREAQIVLALIAEFDGLGARDRGSLNNALISRIREDYRQFADYAASTGPALIRLPTIRSTGFGTSAILRHKPIAENELLSEITSIDNITDEEQWHGKRILLKRYRHTIDAFALCPGQLPDEKIMKHIALLEQLLGDWHDRVISAEILRALPGPVANRDSLIDSLLRQGDALLESAKLYLRKLGTRFPAGE